MVSTVNLLSGHWRLGLNAIGLRFVRFEIQDIPISNELDILKSAIC